jgi:exonuclease VII large subunit
MSKQKFTAYRANVIYMKLKDNIGSRLIARYQQSTILAQRRLFNRWKTQAMAANLLIRLKKDAEEHMKQQRRQHEEL